MYHPYISIAKRQIAQLKGGKGSEDNLSKEDIYIDNKPMTFSESLTIREMKSKPQQDIMSRAPGWL